MKFKGSNFMWNFVEKLFLEGFKFVFYGLMNFKEGNNEYYNWFNFLLLFDNYNEILLLIIEIILFVLMIYFGN